MKDGQVGLEVGRFRVLGDGEADYGRTQHIADAIVGEHRSGIEPNGLPWYAVSTRAERPHFGDDCPEYITLPERRPQHTARRSTATASAQLPCSARTMLKATWTS